MNYKREHGCRAWLTHGNLPQEGLAQLWKDYGSASEIFERFVYDHGFINEYAPRSCILALHKAADPDRMHQMMLTMRNHDMGILSVDDTLYPHLLKQISDPPILLYYRGDPECLIGKCITMVGSRSASPHGLMVAHDVAQDLARQGATVVSGFAQGIDQACHTGCLDGGGKTCAVLACGLDVVYPAGSDMLRRRILIHGGVMLSEYPPGSPALGWHFPARNRILSGLSKATMMMECPQKSGAMITVQHAIKQNRQVYAYPGQPGTPAAEGAHYLLREGARYFSYADDILHDLGWNETQPPVAKEQKSSIPPLTEDQHRVLSALTNGERSFDQLAADTGLEASALSGALTMLQLLGLIRPMPGKSYVRL